MEALPQAATRSDDATDEEKAEGATLLPTSTLRSDDDRAEEEPAVKSAVAATPGPVKKAQLLNAAKSAGLDDETSQRLWTALLAEFSAAEPRHVSEATSQSCWSAIAADVAKAVSHLGAYHRKRCCGCTNVYFLVLGWWLFLLAATLVRIMLTSEEDSAPSPTNTVWPPCEIDSSLSSLSPIISLWYDRDCLCGTANATQTAAALSAQLTGSLEPDAILSVVLSGLGLFLLSRLGGIPVPDRPEGVVLYVIWMAVQLLQYVTVLFSLLMSAASLFHATHALEGCARNPTAISWSLYLTLGVQPALVAPALVLFLYAYAFSTGLKVWTATRAMASGEVNRDALVQKLKSSTQTRPVASFHYWLAYFFFALTCAGLVLSAAALPVAAMLLPASAVIVVAIKGIYWLAGPIERGLLPKPDQCYGVDLGAGLTTWLNELHDSSFAPGGFSLEATLRSPGTMFSNKDDPALATLGLSLGVFWLLLALAVPVCYGMWLTLPLLLGVASVSEVAARPRSLWARL